jgi:hypothetical protein
MATSNTGTGVTTLDVRGSVVTVAAHITDRGEIVVPEPVIALVPHGRPRDGPSPHTAVAAA